MGMSSSTCIERGDYVHKSKHTEGPVVWPSRAQFRKAEFPNFVLSTQKGNNVCMVSETIIMIHNIIIDCSGNDMIVGKKFASWEDLFATPCRSSKFNVHVVSTLANLAHWPLDKLTCKFVMLPHRKPSFVVSPIIHTKEFSSNFTL
ncbi:unnamed protein product [Ixodes persulcatus]